MKLVEYTQLAPSEPISETVRYRFQPARIELIRLGFKELCCYRETTFPFGFFLYLPVLSQEIAKLHGLLRVSLHVILLTAQEYAAYALVFGMGVKFYTLFLDGTGLITANFETSTIQNEVKKLYKVGRPGSISDAWDFHRTEVQRLRQSGKQTKDTLSFANYVEFCQTSLQ